MALTLVCALVFIVALFLLAVFFPPTKHSRRIWPRLAVELLENRLAPTTLREVVNSTQDLANPPAGTVTLRSAIAAGAQGDTVNVYFDAALLLP